MKMNMQVYNEGLKNFTTAISKYLITIPKDQAVKKLLLYELQDLNILNNTAFELEDYEVCSIIEEVRKIKQNGKLCKSCNNLIQGRPDKIYCNNTCRGNYNNKLNSAANNYVRNINHVLGKNRRILQTLLNGERNVKVAKEKILIAGYNFEYHTHQTNTAAGKTYYYCYEYGYLLLENNCCLIVKRND